MAEKILQFHLPCGGVTSVDATEKEFERTKTFSEGVVFGCKMCNSTCTFWKISRTETYGDFLKMLLIDGELQNPRSA